MQREAQGGGRGVFFLVGVFVQVAEALLVFFQPEVQVAGFEGFVAELFDFGDDFEDFWAGAGFGLVFGVVFVRVAGRVDCFRGGGFCVVVVV